MCSDCSSEIYEAALNLIGVAFLSSSHLLCFRFYDRPWKCFELLGEEMWLSLIETDVKGSGAVGLVLLRDSDIL